MEGIKHYLIDMDGVILRGAALIPGAAEFVQRLRAREIPFLILTNNSRYIPRDLHDGEMQCVRVGEHRADRPDDRDLKAIENPGNAK